MKAFYCDQFVLPLPEGHRFPMEKYSRLRERVLAAGIVTPEDLIVPHAATDGEILRAHDAGYLRRVAGGELDRAEVRRIGFPWSPAMVERSRRSAGGTIEACRAALADGAAVNLAGGTHHAFRDHGEGYCVFNDAAIASRAMQAEARVERVVVIDCDVHQGNGTAAIFADDPTVFTFSIHGRNNSPSTRSAATSTSSCRTAPPTPSTWRPWRRPRAGDPRGPGGPRDLRLGGRSLRARPAGAAQGSRAGLLPATAWCSRTPRAGLPVVWRWPAANPDVADTVEIQLADRGRGPAAC